MVAASGAGRKRRQCSRRVDSGFTICAKGCYVKSMVVALLTIMAPAESQEKEGDWCLNDDGFEGICRHLRHCPYLQSKAYVYNGGGADTPDLCSYGDGGAVVCCPTVTPPTALSGTTPAPAKPSVPSVRLPRPPAARPPAVRPPAVRPPAVRPPSAQPPVLRRPASRPPASPAAQSADLGDSDTVVITPDEDTATVRISEQKCHEYMNSLEEDVTALRADAGLSESWCPYPPPGNELIVGGLAANTGEYPHMAALGYVTRRQVEWLCGGSLISHTYVLTAAHCLRGSLIAVSLGSLRVTNMSVVTVRQNMEGAGDYSNIYPVAESLRHPRFTRFSHYDDIALVRLAVPVRTFDLHVRPACLHTDRSMDGIQSAVACGFGHTVYKDSSTSRLLRHVTLKVYSLDVCSQVFSAVINTAKLSRGILDSQTCAGQMAGGKDTCDGDSGGPLQTRDKKDRCIVRIIGITSFGASLCGEKNTAALYTRVSHYIPWIESVVWPAP